MSTKKSSSSPLPAGLEIGNIKYPWKVGKVIGSGACGAVHELQLVNAKPSSTRSYVIKVAPMPPPPTSGKKRKKSAMERNADLIYHETVLLTNGLISLQGTYIPYTPEYNELNAPPTSGIIQHNDLQSWRYLVMERMGSNLADWATKIDGKNICLGAVANRMLACLEQLHQRQYVYIDVKMENFMLSLDTKTTTTTKSTSTDSLAKAVRLIDFGLVESLYDGGTSKHREDMFPNASMVGTPLYASLNLLKGHTPARRDDLEALGYVLADLLLMSAASSTESQLPWRKGKSDQDILKLKEASLANGELYKLISRAEDASLLKEYFEIVQAVEYTKIPDYTQLQTILGSLRGGSDKPATGKRPLTAVKKSTRSAPIQEEESLGDSPAKRRKSPTGKVIPVATILMEQVNNRASRLARRVAAAASTESKPSKAKTKTEKENKGENGVEPMEWEPTSSNSNTKEDIERSDASSNTVDARPKLKVPNTSQVVFRLRFIEGPGTDTVFDVEKSTICIIGRNPKARSARGSKKVVYCPTPFDDQISTEHLKVEVNSATANKTKSLKLTDLKATNGTSVKGQTITQGGSKVVFANERIHLGNSVIKIELAD